MFKRTLSWFFKNRAIIKDLYLAPLVLKHNITMAKQVISNNLGFCVINFTSAIFKYSIGKSSAYWMYTPKKKSVK